MLTRRNTLIMTTALLWMLLNGRLLGQQKGTPITFHVTAVRSEEEHDVGERCQGDCSRTRITVEGYSNATEYVLACVEVTAYKPSTHLVVSCGRVHANNDYIARRYADSIAFGEYKPQSPDEPVASAYEIVSEQEVNKLKR